MGKSVEGVTVVPFIAVCICKVRKERQMDDGGPLVCI